MWWRAVNKQTKEIRRLPESEAFNLDKRIWDITEISQVPQSHRFNDDLKVIEIIVRDGFSFAGRIALAGRGCREHNFNNCIMVHRNLTPYNGRWMKESW